MIARILLVGESGIGKTHMCLEIAEVVNSVLIDVDDGSEPIIQKLESDVTVLKGRPFDTFINSLKQAIKSDAELIIIDSLTELKEIIVRHMKGKILSKGEFFIGGIERETPKKIADPDLFVLTWELRPALYDKIRDIKNAITSSGKSLILTYHPPAGERVSEGEAKMLSELKRITDITAYLEEDEVIIKKDRFFNKKNMHRNEFKDYIKSIIEAKNIKEVEV